MIKIFENEELMGFAKSLKNDFRTMEKDVAYLERFYSHIDEVETWRYSTGPIFDEPPFVSEMAGFDGGRLIKRSYPSIYEARLKGAYSSGFIGDDHVVTISPSSLGTSPLMATFFKEEVSGKTKHTINYYNNKAHSSRKPPALVGLARLFDLNEATKAYIVAGSGPAYSITLYHYDAKQKIASASMVTAPFDFQSNYEMHYDEDGTLESITSGGIVWKRKGKN